MDLQKASTNVRESSSQIRRTASAASAPSQAHAATAGRQAGQTHSCGAVHSPDSEPVVDAAGEAAGGGDGASTVSAVDAAVVAAVAASSAAVATAWVLGAPLPVTAGSMHTVRMAASSVAQLCATPACIMVERRAWRGALGGGEGASKYLARRAVFHRKRWHRTFSRSPTGTAGHGEQAACRVPSGNTLLSSVYLLLVWQSQPVEPCAHVTGS